MTKNIELRDSIVSALNKVDESAFGAEVAVMESMYQAYDRALTVIANYDGDITQDFGLFQESFIMEDGEEKDQVLKQDGQKYHTKEGFRRAEKGDDGKLKVESMFKTIIAFIPRLIGFIYKKIVGFFKGDSTQQTTTAVDGIKNVLGILTDSDKDLLDRISELFQSNDFINGLLGAGGIAVGVAGVAGLANFITFKTKEATFRENLVKSFTGLFGAKTPENWFNTKKIPSPEKVYNKIKIVTKGTPGIKNLIIDLVVVRTFFEDMKKMTDTISGLIDDSGKMTGNIDKEIFNKSEPYKLIVENPKNVIPFDQFTEQLKGVTSSQLPESMQNCLKKFEKARDATKASDASEDLKKQAADIETMLKTYNTLTTVVLKLVDVISHLNQYVVAHRDSLNEIKKKFEEMGGDDKNKVSKMLSGLLLWLWSRWENMKGKLPDAQNVDEEEAKAEDIETETSSESTEETEIVPNASTESSEESQIETPTPDPESTNTSNPESTHTLDDASDPDIREILDTEYDSNPNPKKTATAGDAMHAESYIERANSSYWNSFI